MYYLIAVDNGINARGNEKKASGVDVLSKKKGKKMKGC